MYPAELPPHVRPAPQEHRTIGRLVTQGLLEPDRHFGRAGLGGTVLELGRRLIHVYREVIRGPGPIGPGGHLLAGDDVEIAR